MTTNKRARRGHWMKENVMLEALKYDSRVQFENGSGGAYDAALRYHWMDDCCQHMKPIGNIMFRCIYSFEFTDNHVYVGLTGNLSERFKDHMLDGPVKNHIDKTGLIPDHIQLTDYLPVEESREVEGYYQEKYNEEGWIALHSAKPGSIGGHMIRIKKEDCAQEALRYLTRMEFKNNSSLYYTACKRNWLDDICSHMVELQKPKRYWNKERCAEEALKYSMRKDFSKNSAGAYDSAINNGWLNEICSHMIILRSRA